MISLAVSFFIRIPVIPVLPFIKLDLSDVPALLAALISGIPSGITVLLSSCIIRALLFSSAGIVGFIVRTTSIILVVGLGIYRNVRGKLKKAAAIVLSCLICSFIKVPINYFFWVYFFGIPKDLLDDLLIPFVLPFNIFKSLLNCFLAVLLLKPMNELLKKVASHQ